MSEQRKLYGTVLIHAKKILDFIMLSAQAPTLTEITEGVDISKPTVLKILTTLEFLNFVYRDEVNKTYYIGTAMIGYSEKALSGLDITKIAKPYLTKIRDITGETVHLGIEEHNEIVFLEKIEGNRSVALKSRVGGDLPMYCSSMGKATLATKTKEEIEKYADSVDFLPRAENTITNKARLLKEINDARKCGYAIDDRENENEVMCIGAAIEKDKHVYGAFSVSVPAYRMTPDQQQKIIDLVLDAKAKISKQV